MSTHGTEDSAPELLMLLLIAVHACMRDSSVDI